jgi:alpha-tubulin suppressor-like RCC1 family protein
MAKIGSDRNLRQARRSRLPRVAIAGLGSVLGLAAIITACGGEDDANRPVSNEASVADQTSPSRESSIAEPDQRSPAADSSTGDTSLADVADAAAVADADADADAKADAGAADGAPVCLGATDAAGLTDAMQCAGPSCSDGTKNEGETGPDCGGPCGPCANNEGCNSGGDCESGYCFASVCKPWATAISVGGGSACALTSGGGVKCWGANTYGQLGNNSTTQSTVPVDVQGLTSGVSSISVGGLNACAVTTGGGAKCWVYNGEGGLGNNSTTQSSVPVDVSGLTAGVASISAATNFTCAVTTAGGAKCWGAKYNGELGNGSETESHVPVDVSGLSSGVIALAAGYENACAIVSGGGVVCWGINLDGELGTTAPGNHSDVPVAVTNLSSGATQLSVAIASCAVTTGGILRCWGSNFAGGVGNNSDMSVYSATPIGLGGPAAYVSTTGSSCAVTTAGAVECWGSNSQGGFGNGTTTSSAVPVATLLTSGVKSVSAGGWTTQSTCALTTAGKVLCWGDNSTGGLGNGTTTSSLTPVPVTEN